MALGGEEEELRLPAAVCCQVHLCWNAAPTIIIAMRPVFILLFLLALGASLTVACGQPSPNLTRAHTPTIEPTGILATAPTPSPNPMGTSVPGNHRGNALAIELGEVASFSITSPDTHVFEVQLEEGITYSIDVSMGTLEYSIAALKDTEGATLKYTVLAGDRLATRIVWTARRSGSYFVEMYGPRDSGSYTLTVTEGEIPRPPKLVQQPPSPPIPTATPSSAAPPTPSAAALTFAAVSAGGEHTCGVTTSGAAYCWGQNGFGQVGNGGAENDFQTTPVAVSGGLTFASVRAGWKHTCGVTTGGAAYCWGSGPQGKLGNGSTDSQFTPAAVSGGLTFASVSPGSVHTCGVTTSGGAFCWGAGSFGRLGNGTDDRVWTPEPVSGRLAFTSISTHTSHTCGVTTSGAAYCWGDGTFGKLGNGTEDGHPMPVAVSGELAFKSVSAGEFHNCGVTTSGAAYCWGVDDVGQLGNDLATESQTTPVAVGPPVDGQ